MKPMVSTFWEYRGLNMRTCKQVQWSFVGIAAYEPAEIIKHYEEKWNTEHNPLSPELIRSGHQGVFFPIFNFTTSKFELSIKKYLGYVVQNITQKEYAIGNYVYVCSLKNTNN